jgi:hypothetical protein
MVRFISGRQHWRDRRRRSKMVERFFLWSFSKTATWKVETDFSSREFILDDPRRDICVPTDLLADFRGRFGANSQPSLRFERRGEPTFAFLNGACLFLPIVLVGTNCVPPAGLRGRDTNNTKCRLLYIIVV